MTLVNINKFYGGKSDDIRQPLENVFSYASHFDIWSNPYRATPFVSMVAADATAGSNIRNFIYGDIGTNIYALGVNSASANFMRIFSGNYASASSLATATNGTFSAQQKDSNDECFKVRIAYGDYLWGICGTGMTKVWKYGTLSGSPTLNEAVATISPTAGTTYTRATNAIIGSDNNVYFILSNPSTPNVDVIKIDINGSVTVAPLALPDDEIPTCIATFGSYLAIGTVKPTDTLPGSSSRIYFWDYVSSDVTDKIKPTEGSIVAMGEVNGRLITVSKLIRTGFGSAVGTNTVVGIVNNRETETLKTIYGVTPSTSRVQVYAGNLYFAGTHNSDYAQTGIYAVGRPSAQYDWGVTMEYQAVANGVTSNPSAVTGFYIVDDYMWLSHSTDNVTKSYNGGTYSNTSIIETQINPKMALTDRHKTKKLNAFRINYVPINGGTIAVKYKIEGGSYTTIFSHTTATGESSFESTVDANGSLFNSAREYQFKIESTGGVEPTGYDYDYDLLTSDQLYE